jgi:hypothetical protein
MDSKNSFLINQGWHNDTNDNFDPINEEGTATANKGLQTRCGWFREDYNLANDWRPEGFTMTGRLLHELVGVDKCMPPGIKINLLSYQYSQI